MTERTEVKPALPDGVELLHSDIAGLYIVKDNRLAEDGGKIVAARDVVDAIWPGRGPAQINHMMNNPNAVRGFHGELINKICAPLIGTTIFVVADLNPDSKTAFKVHYQEVKDGSGLTFFVSKGLAVAVCNPTQEASHYFYSPDSDFDAQKRAGKVMIRWDDADLTRQFGGWPVNAAPITSEKDNSAPSIREAFPEVDFSKLPWLL